MANQERFKPQAEKNEEDRSKVADLRGSPMSVGNLEELIVSTTLRLTLITAWDAWMCDLIKWRGSLTLTTLLIYTVILDPYVIRDKKGGEGEIFLGLWLDIEGEMHMFRGRVSHDLKRVTNALVTKSELIRVEGSKKGRGRPKITSIEVIKSHL